MERDLANPPSTLAPTEVQKELDVSPPTVTLPSRPDYEVFPRIGRGAYGEVYLARDQVGAYWAVKVVYRASFEDAGPYEREYRGIQTFAPISKLSESQLQVIHVGRRDEAGYFYYIMEAADDVDTGRAIHPETYRPNTLKSELERRKSIPADECCHVAWGLSVALERLHQHGLLHRDIKPANIIFVNGRPKLADVGLVIDVDKARSFAGTEGYIAPEGPGSFQADIYSLGMVLYEMCTGLDRRDFPKLPENFSELPDHSLLLRLNKVVTKSCEISPHKRYQTATQVREDLEKLLLRNAPATPKRTRKLAYVIAMVTLLGLAAWLIAKRSHAAARTSPPQPEATSTAPVTQSPATASAQPIAVTPQALGNETLQHALTSYYWQWEDSGTPSSPIRFRENGTVENRRFWRYWVTGPRTMHVQFRKKEFDPKAGVTVTFNEWYTQFAGEATLAHHLHRIKGTRLATP